MSERRRSARQILEHPGMGTICVIQDVDISHIDAKEAVVIAAGAIPAGERLLLSIPDDLGGDTHTHVARVAHSRVVVRDGALRSEVRLLIAERAGDSAAAIGQSARRMEQRCVVRGSLSRRVPMRIVEVSASGCLWESPSTLEDGAVAWVQIRSARQSHNEAVRVVHTRQSEQSTWPYRTAVEFLTLGPSSPESFRGVAALAAVR